MKTAFRGTFVVTWAQTEINGLRSAPVADLHAGAAWRWTGEALRVDGARGVLPLGEAEGQARLRRRAAHTVRRLRGGSPLPPPLLLQDPLFDRGFTVTDGRDTWEVAVIGMGAGRKPLCMFHGEIPPRDSDLWVVRDTLDAGLRHEAEQPAQGVICFTPGTMILTPQGPRDVAALVEGDRISTQDNGSAEILWIGQRRVTGARLLAMPALRPVRLRAGALDRDVPDEGLLVSPDHRVVLRGPRARALFGTEEVLVAARDLIDDRMVLRDHAVRQVSYIHLLLPRHEVVFANGVATESFHPASAALAGMQDVELERMFNRLPDLRGDPSAYGAHARRTLGPSEAAILQHDLAGHPLRRRMWS